MGFPGTTGASYVEYLITDEFVSPLKYSHIYSEKLVRLPHCYFVNDYKQMFLILFAHTSEPTMICPRTNLCLHASISSTRWTQIYSTPGAIFSSVYQTVHYGY